MEVEASGGVTIKKKGSGEGGSECKSKSEKLKMSDGYKEGKQECGRAGTWKRQLEEEVQRAD